MTSHKTKIVESYIKTESIMKANIISLLLLFSLSGCSDWFSTSKNVGRNFIGEIFGDKIKVHYNNCCPDYNRDTETFGLSEYENPEIIQSKLSDGSIIYCSTCLDKDGIEKFRRDLDSAIEIKKERQELQSLIIGFCNSPYYTKYKDFQCEDFYHKHIVQRYKARADKSIDDVVICELYIYAMNQREQYPLLFSDGFEFSDFSFNFEIFNDDCNYELFGNK